MIPRFALLAAALFVGANNYSKAGGKTYYVSNAGNDNNPGTVAKPIKTLNKVNSLVLKAGDAVYFKGGEIFKGSLLMTKGIQATQQRPVIISSYGIDRAVIDARDSIGCALYQSSYVTLSHISLRGSGRKTGNIRNGLYVLNCNHITIDDLNISGFQKSGLLIYSSQNVVANKIFSHDNGSAGITVEGPYTKTESNHIRILHCRAENNPGDPTNLTNHSGNGIVVGNCKNVLIDHCTATNNGWDMPRIGNGPVGIWAYEADSVIIQHCLSYKNKTSKGGADGGGFDFDGGVTNSVVQYCMSYGNQGSGYCIFQYWGATPWFHNIFRYNISENDGTVSDSQAGLYIWNSSDDEKQFHDCEVYGNIIYNDKVAAISFSEKSESKGIHMYNNIFVGKDSLIKGKDKIGDVKYWENDWWSIEKGFSIDGITNLEDWAKQTGLEQKDGKLIGFNIKPDFLNAGNTSITSAAQLKNYSNYTLAAKSELRNQSVYIGKYGVGNIKHGFAQNPELPDANIQEWLDTEGNFINAHGAGVLYHHGVYYLYGEIKKGDTWQVAGQNWEDYRVPAGGVSCYSSKDLKNWRYEGVALSPVIGDPSNDLDTGRVIERPKVIYNRTTKKFVMWMHIDKNDYSYARAGVAVSDKPAGPFQYIGSVQPNQQMSRDMTLFQDDDGKAYLVYSSEQNNTMQVCLLHNDYLSPTKTFNRILVDRNREAPALFKSEGKYYLITSSCTGWAPNAATYAVADKPLGPWKEYGNPCLGPDAGTTFESQSTYVLPVYGKAKTFLFMADTWNKTNLEKSGYLWLPLKINNGKVEIKK